MKLYPTKQKCACVADTTHVTSVRAERRGRPPTVKRSVQVHHVRYLEGVYPEGHEMADVRIAERFWHWADQEPVIV